VAGRADLIPWPKEAFDRTVTVYMDQVSVQQTAVPTIAPPPARWVAPARARLFLGISIPAPARATITATFSQFPHYIEKTIAEERWHLTLLFLGDVENPQQYLSRLLKPNPQAYVPTVSVMHVGRGLNRLQLWAYCHPSTSLLNLQTQFADRLRTMRFPFPKNKATYVPHIHLANLYPMARGIGIADVACATRFAVTQVHLYESLPLGNSSTYTIRASIPLTT